MTKKLFSFWLAIMAMLCMPTVVQANVTVKFKCTHQGESISPGTIRVYHNGELIKTGTQRTETDSETGTYLYYSVVTFDEAYIGKTLGYTSGLGHRGEFTLSETNDVVELQCTKLTVTVKDEDGKPDMSMSSSITLAGASRYTDMNGQVIFYVAPDVYLWSWQYPSESGYVSESGSIDLSTDQTLELTVKKPVVAGKYNVTVICHYGNFPVTSSIIVYENEVKKTSVSSSTVNLAAGTYQIYDVLGGYGGEFEIKSDTTLYLNYRKVTLVSKRGSTPNIGQSISLKLKEGGFKATSVTTDGKGVAENYLLPGTYTYTIGVGSGEFTVAEEDVTVNIETAKLTVKVIDTAGKVVANSSITLSNGNKNKATTDSNGIAVFNCMQGEGTISWTQGTYNGALVSQNVNVNGDTEVTFTIPSEITFKLAGWGKEGSRTIYNSNGVAVANCAYGTNIQRLDPNEEYCFDLGTITVDGKIRGTTKITDGCTITIGKLNITSEGMGLAFPTQDTWEPVSSYYVIVGSSARLTAIPVSDQFMKWTINGKDYTDPMMDFKITELTTEAKAVFGENNPSNVRPVMSNSSLDYDDCYITLPGEMEGTARIYTFDGKLVKQLGVVGDQIGIYDLPAGAYVVSFQHGDGVINAQFLKK